MFALQKNAMRLATIVIQTKSALTNIKETNVNELKIYVNRIVVLQKVKWKFLYPYFQTRILIKKK